MEKHTYGWKPDDHDPRDLRYGAVHPNEAVPVLPARCTNRTDTRLIRPYDQGQFQSCTANGWSTMMAYLHPGFLPSRMALYYAERLAEGSLPEDEGAMIRTGAQVLASTGVGTEEEWSYVEDHLNEPPSQTEVADALNHKAIIYTRLCGSDDYRTCLAAGFPFVIGITLFEAFESEDVASTGLVPLPEGQPIGGHCITVIGYDDNFQNGGTRYYECRNSWGSSWGDNGNFWIPASYLEDPNLASDAWTLRKTT
jgi:C1A family cysteine protease